MAKSLPPVSAKVIADIEQFVSEFKRAENVARRSADQIDREVGDLAKKIKNKFSLADVGKDILKGAGLFGGFQIAQTAAELIVDYFRDAAEQAKSIEASTTRQLEITKEIIKLRQTDEQRRAALDDEIARARRDMEEKASTRYSLNLITTGPEGGQVVEKIARAHTAAETAEVQKLATAYMELLMVREKLKVADEKSEQAQNLRDTADRVKQYGKELADKLRLEHANRKAEGERVEKLADAANNYRDMADATRAYYRELDKVTDLEKRGKLTAEEALAARKAIAEAHYKGAPNKSGVSIENVDTTISTIDEDTKALANTAKDLGLTFSSAFEDAIVSGEKLSDVLRGLAQDVLRIFVRSTITTPMAGALTSMFGGLFGGGKADGGPVAGGTPYIVGERGPELFVPRSSGTIVPNHAMGGGDTFVFSPQVAAGVTRQDLAGMMPDMFERFAATVADKARRSRDYRSAFAT